MEEQLIKGNITIPQADFIKDLSSYHETEKEDNADIQSFLSSLNKRRIEELDIIEASKLIQILLKRPIKYIFPCGKEEFVSKKDYQNDDNEGQSCINLCFLYCRIGPNNCWVMNPNVIYKSAIEKYLSWIIESIKSSKDGIIRMKIKDIAKEMGVDFENKTPIEIYSNLRDTLSYKDIIVDLGIHNDGDELLLMRFSTKIRKKKK